MKPASANTVDHYRVNLFKKNLREHLGAPWIRFYWSKDKSHLCLSRYHHGEGNMETIATILRRARIDFKETRDQFGLHKIFGNPKVIPKIDQISIPIDQEALPERKRAL